MDIVLFHSLWTLSLLALFIGIVAWAWSGKRKAQFDEAARLPLDDDIHGRMSAARGRMPGAADKNLTTRGEHNHG